MLGLGIAHELRLAHRTATEPAGKPIEQHRHLHIGVG
jgi:hypothetical protein